MSQYPSEPRGVRLTSPRNITPAPRTRRLCSLLNVSSQWEEQALKWSDGFRPSPLSDTFPLPPPPFARRLNVISPACRGTAAVDCSWRQGCSGGSIRGQGKKANEGLEANVLFVLAKLAAQRHRAVLSTEINVILIQNVKKKKRSTL